MNANFTHKKRKKKKTAVKCQIERLNESNDYFENKTIKRKQYKMVIE